MLMNSSNKQKHCLKTRAWGHTRKASHLVFHYTSSDLKVGVLLVRKVVAVGGREPQQRVWSFWMV